MMSLKTMIYTIIFIFFFIYLTTSLFNFVGIEFASYGNYLLWFICLILFYLILPSKVGNFFSGEK
jgi:hypothetical protein